MKPKRYKRKVIDIQPEDEIRDCVQTVYKPPKKRVEEIVKECQEPDQCVTIKCKEPCKPKMPKCVPVACEPAPAQRCTPAPAKSSCVSYNYC